MTDNSTIMASVWLEAGTDFQQRIPNPSQSGIKRTVDALFDPKNRPWLNQFMDILVNRIAYTYVHNKVFENPFNIFKREQLEYGTTVAEAALKFIKAHSYRDDWGDRVDDIENLLKVHRPDGSVAYHTVNREDTYPISVNTMELRGAFNNEYGLNNLISAIMQLPTNSDNYDEYRIFLELISFYEQEHGFFKHQLSGAPSDEATGKEFLQAVRSYAGKLRFPSSLYNAQTVTDIPVWINADEQDELLLIVTPETQAVLDVQTLASVFNVELAEIKYRTLIVDTMPVPDAVALLTTSDFFVCADYAYETTSFFNPQTLTENYYLHHIGMYSVSPFVPAILFTTAEGTQVATAKLELTSLELTASAAEVEAGGTVDLVTQIEGTLTATPAGADLGSLTVAPDSATWKLTAVDGNGTGVDLAYDTYVDRFGVMHVSEREAAGTVITVVATSTYVNPSGETEEFVANVTVTVVAGGSVNPSIAVTPKTATIPEDGVVLTAATYPADAEVSWSVGNENIAYIGDFTDSHVVTAYITGEETGTTTIEARITVDGAVYMDTVSVTVG